MTKWITTLSFASSTFYLNLIDGGTSQMIYSTQDLDKNTWIHLSVTYDSNVVNLYVNASLTNSLTGVTFGHVIGATNYIGNDAVFDELKFFARSLDADEIRSEMNKIQPNIDAVI